VANGVKLDTGRYIDRQAAENDYKVNIKAELETSSCIKKIDQLRVTEVQLTHAVSDLTSLLRKAEAPYPSAATVQ